jgi:hypothetical protein
MPDLVDEHNIRLKFTQNELINGHRLLLDQASKSGEFSQGCGGNG